MNYDFNLDSAGGQQDFKNWVSRTVKNEINSYARQVLGVSNTNASAVSAGVSSSAASSASNMLIPSGVIVPFAGGPGVTPNPGTRQDVPVGWLVCDGSAVSRNAYSGLFTIIGTTYGVGDGSTTFNVPDLRGRVVAGKDNMGGTAQNRLTTAGGGVDGVTLGASGGVQTHSHTVNSHQHTFSIRLLEWFGSASNSAGAGRGAYRYSDGQWAGWYYTGTSGTGNVMGLNSAQSVSAYINQTDGDTTSASPGTNSISNISPTLIINYIIKT